MQIYTEFNIPIDNGIGKRWKWDRHIPDFAIWPQCNKCNSFLPVRNYIKRIFIGQEEYIIRECPRCHILDTRKYYGECE